MRTFTPTTSRGLGGRPRRRATPAELRHRSRSGRRDECAHRGGTAGKPPVGGRHVLVVDDEASIRLICKINLNASGWACDEAENGEQAMQRIKTEHPDVVLLDVMMPLVDGWTVAERLAADPETRDVPIVFMTARAERRDREHAVQVGAVGYITKPLDPVTLPEMIEQILVRLANGEREELRAELLDDGA